MEIGTCESSLEKLQCLCESCSNACLLVTKENQTDRNLRPHGPCVTCRSLHVLRVYEVTDA